MHTCRNSKGMMRFVNSCGLAINTMEKSLTTKGSPPNSDSSSSIY
jgi:DNA-binding phage protein